MWYFGRVSVDPKNPDIAYCPNVALMRSTDAGKTLTPIKGAPRETTTIIYDRSDNDDCMIVASDQGTVISVDGGKHWSSGTTSRQNSFIMSVPTIDSHTEFTVTARCRYNISYQQKRLWYDNI